MQYIKMFAIWDLISLCCKSSGLGKNLNQNRPARPEKTSDQNGPARPEKQSPGFTTLLPHTFLTI